jgi:hypothetical protein
MQIRTRHGIGLIHRDPSHILNCSMVGQLLGRFCCPTEVRAAQRQATDEHLATLEPEWAQPLEEFICFSTLCEALLAGTLQAQGFHQHDRGAWRKR